MKYAYHMPLACDIYQWESLSYTDEDKKTYGCDISFVGSLYNDYKINKYNYISTFPPHIKGYLDGIISAQQNVYGYNFLEECLNDDLIHEIKKYLTLDLGPYYYENYKKLLTNILNKQVTMLERSTALDKLSEVFEIALYTGSDTSSISSEKIKLKGYIDYMSQMPKVFRYSKINLNITSKSITSGIPLRVFDILGAGGFLISNYQTEVAEYFENGVEVVLYDSMSDLVDKVNYYLHHDDERKKIAKAGYQKVKSMFSYKSKLQDIMNLSESNIIK